MDEYNNNENMNQGQNQNTDQYGSNGKMCIRDRLTVTPRTVILTSGSAEKEYDGTPLTNATVTVSGSGFAAGEGAVYDVTGSQTEAGSSANAFTYQLNDGTKKDNLSLIHI